MAKALLAILALIAVSCTTTPAQTAATLPSLDEFAEPCVPSHPHSNLAVWAMGQPITPIEGGETLSIHAFWVPAEGHNAIEVANWITPAPGTDILANTECDGSGRNAPQTALDAWLTNETPNSVDVHVENLSSERIYLTLLQVRGALLCPEARYGLCPR